MTRKPLRQAVHDALDEAKSQTCALFELGNLADIYFTDRIVLCEGKTDHRLLPLAYEQLYHQAPELDHIAFVSLGSCSDIPKALPVLASMGIKACAVADLDFAFTHARTGATPLLAKSGADLEQVKRILSRLQPQYGFTLGENGLPTNNRQTGWPAADVWALMARDKKGSTVVEVACNNLKGHSVWVWPMGCIEQVTDHTDKGEDGILEQEEMLRGMDVADIENDMPAFKDCFEWIRNL